jgi:ribosome maturation factor RimP
MINTKHISSLVDAGLKDTGIFLVEAEVRQGNHIRVYIDNQEGVTIEECAKVSRIIESGLDRETEDFDLEVSSPGLNEPFKVLPQYIKNIGRNLEVIRNDGIRLSGKLLSTDKKGITLEVRDNTKGKTAKTKEDTIKNEYILFSDIKATRLLIIF